MYKRQVKVTTEQLVIDLYHLWRGGKGTVRTLLVPVPGCGFVLRLERTQRELIATFETLEPPLGLGSFDEWRDDEPTHCNTCGAVIPAIEDATCYHCSTQAVS